MRPVRLPALLWVFFLACTHTQPVVVSSQGGGQHPVHVNLHGDYAPRINDESVWHALAASPGRELAAHTEVVKVIIDMDDGWKVYFLQSVRWEIHYFFA